MNLERVFAMSFAGVYPHYVTKVERKGRTRAELDEALCWLTGYDAKQLARVIETKVDLRTFFKEAPRLNPKAKQITGTICGVKIDEIEDPLMKKIRWMDKLVDEIAKGRPMEKVLRSEGASAVAPKRASPAKAAKPAKTAAPVRRAKKKDA